MLTGFSSNGATAYFYDENLSLTKEIETMDLPGEDLVTMESGIAISSDGKKLALAGTYGLYVYDLENENIERLLVQGDRFADDSIEILFFNSVTFLCENTQIAYCGRGRSSLIQQMMSRFPSVVQLRSMGSTLTLPDHPIM